ncbi:MAG TPA: YfbM family protein [Blastocatellia bacterium]|nr:YfbM family protein [Blastocatellia bacterium]
MTSKQNVNGLYHATPQATAARHHPGENCCTASGALTLSGLPALLYSHKEVDNPRTQIKVCWMVLVKALRIIMSMNLTYRSVSPRTITKLLEDPALVRAILDFDPGATESGMPTKLRQLLEKVPPEMRERAAEMLSAQMKKVEEMGPGRTFAELSTLAARSLETAGLESADLGEPVDIGKAWHGLHFLLAGTEWEPTDPPGNVVFGGKEIGEDLGYGPARLLTPEDVVQTARALASIDEVSLRSSYDPKAFEAAKIYAGGWDDPEELDWIIDSLRITRDCFNGAAERGHGLIIFVT